MEVDCGKEDGGGPECNREFGPIELTGGGR